MTTTTFNITAAANNQNVYRSGATYASISTYTLTRQVDSASSGLNPQRHYNGVNYTVGNGLLAFDTSSIPDGAVISSAVLRAYVINKNDNDNRSISGEYYAWDGTSASDWSNTPSATAFANVDLTGISVGATHDFTFDVANLGSINKTGLTKIRLHITGAAPTSTNNLPMAVLADTTNPEPQLIVTYATNPTANYTYTTSPLAAAFTDTSTAVSPATITGRAWTFGDGGTSTATNPSHTYTTAGTYSVALTVTDSNGLQSTSTKSVVIPPAVPTANFTYTTSPLAAAFTDTSTAITPQTITARAWTFGDGGTSTATNPSHTYAASGTYSVTLTVTDSAAQQGTTTKSVTIPPAAPNTPPTALFTNTTGALAVTFTDQSTDPDGTIASRSWNFGDAGTSTATNPVHTYAAAGTYTVTLTVTDDKGATGTYTKTLTVRAAGAAISYLAGPIFLRESTLTGGITAVQNTIPVAELAYWPPNGSSWPSANEGMIDPDGTPEKITWTGKSANSGPGNLTGVVRGAYGTTAGTHSSGAAIGLYGRHDAGLYTKRQIPTFPVNASLTLQELRRHSDSERFVWADFDNLNEIAQLDILGSPLASGSVSTTLDEAGVATTRTAAVTATAEVRSLTINNAQTALGTISLTLDSITRTAVLPGGFQQHQIVFSDAPTNATAKLYYYDASNVYQEMVLVPFSSTSATGMAQELRNISVPGWTFSGSGKTVIATATTTGRRGASPYTKVYSGFYIYTSAKLVSVATNAMTLSGSAFLTAAQVASQIRLLPLSGWIIGGTGATLTFTSTTPGAKAGTFSYSAGATGATSTSGVTQTTAGAQTTAAAVATAIRTLYAGNASWTIGGTGTTVTWTALSTGAKLDATFHDGGTGVQGKMQTLTQGSADVVGYYVDSTGAQQSRRLLSNLLTTTVFNLETDVSGAGTDQGVISFWGSFTTSAPSFLWRIDGVDLTLYKPGEGAYGVVSESASGLTWDVRTDEVQLTNRGLTYFREHNLTGDLLGQFHYYGLLAPEQAREDLGVQELWQPITPGQQISLAFYMRYENLSTSLPSRPLFISFFHQDGTITELGDASGAVLGLSGDSAWTLYTLTFTTPTLTDNPSPAYWAHIHSRDMSQGTVIIQELVPTLGATVKRTPYYAFTGIFRAQLDGRTPNATPYLSLDRERTALEVQFDANGGTVDAQYRSADAPTSFGDTWYTDIDLLPDLPVINADVTMLGDGLSTPEVPSGYPRSEYRARPGKRHLFLSPNRTELSGGVIMDQVADWYRKPGTSTTVLPSGHILKQKLNEPVGYLPSFVLWAFRPETVKYLSENLNSAGMLFYAEIFDELLLLNIVTAEPKFTRGTLSRFDNEDLGDTSAATRYSFWSSNELSAEVVSVHKINE